MGVSIGRHFRPGSKSAVLPIDFAPQFAGELAVSVGISGAVKVRAVLMLLDHFSSPGGAVTDDVASKDGRKRVLRPCGATALRERSR